MLRRFSMLCAALLAVAMFASQASASLVLSARQTGGPDASNLLSGDEIQLTISVTVDALPAGFLLWNGGDFLISSGSDATFGTANYLLDGTGAWTAVPPEGGTTRFFTGGPATTAFFNAVGQTRDLGNIILRAGSPGTFSTSFSQVVMLDSNFLPITTSSPGFSYTVGVPEPSSAMLLGLGAAGLAFRRRRS